MAYKYRFGLQKGVEKQTCFSNLENMMFQLSNALSIMFISLKLVKLRPIKVLSVAPPKGHETLPFIRKFVIFRHLRDAQAHSISKPLF